ncbi:MAG: response regulator, partial [Planctomycetota bacterium]
MEDDDQTQNLLQWIIEAAGMRAEIYRTGDEFLRAFRRGATLTGSDGAAPTPSCLVCNVVLPQTSGLDLYESYKSDGGRLPIIFLAAHADVPMAVRALKSGAAEFVEIPFNRNDLLERIQRAVRRDAARRRDERALRDLDDRFAALTQREREVLDGLQRGWPNREIARQAGVTVRAVEMRRAGLMKKMNAGSLAELLHLAWRRESRTPPPFNPPTAAGCG